MRAWEWSSPSPAGVSCSDFLLQNVLSSVNASMQGHPSTVHDPKTKDGPDVTALSWSRALSVSTTATTTNSFLSSDFVSSRVLVSPRQNLTRITLKGTFQGAKVVRGPDWEWGNQDGKLLLGCPVEHHLRFFLIYLRGF